MTVRLHLNTGKLEAEFKNVKHFQICSTGPTPNSRTLLISHRYDLDDQFDYVLPEGAYLVCKED